MKGDLSHGTSEQKGNPTPTKKCKTPSKMNVKESSGTPKSKPAPIPNKKSRKGKKEPIRETQDL